MTKFNVFLSDPAMVKYAMHMAVDQATRGRPGPVWVDVPSDVQAAQMPEHDSMEYVSAKPSRVKFDHFKLTSILYAGYRPVVLAGVGIRQSGCVHGFIKFVEKYNLPFVTTYGTGNFVIQNAGMLLILGTSLGATVVGYDPKQFSPHSYKIYVDIQSGELNKDIIPIDEKLEVPLDQFFGAML
jgi:acetolactate synthase-1/2/3 large subunit